MVKTCFSLKLDHLEGSWNVTVEGLRLECAPKKSDFCSIFINLNCEVALHVIIYSIFSGQGEVGFIVFFNRNNLYFFRSRFQKPHLNKELAFQLLSQLSYHVGIEA